MTTPATPKTLLVTGAAQRLGRTIAWALAEQGWRIAVHCRHSRHEAEVTAAGCKTRSGHDSVVFSADLDNESQVRALLPQVIEHFGTVDGVVNNASLFEHDSSESFSYAMLEKHMRCNTGAPIVLASALHAHLKERQAVAASGVLVNLLDQKLWNLNPDFLSYTLSKAALKTANSVLASALAPWVRVVGVAPGLTLTSHMLSDAEFEQLHQLSPLGKSSTPEDVASAVVFAVSNASLTGTTILVDGGQHLRQFDRDFSMMRGQTC
jgi:NAD(P)-dependent dehydrogenase (short-subunit alcohol dehydrogenase family)